VSRKRAHAPWTTLVSRSGQSIRLCELNKVIRVLDVGVSTSVERSDDLGDGCVAVVERPSRTEILRG
jgi:hypothetical protein